MKNRPIHLVGAETVGCQIRGGNRSRNTSLAGLARLVVADYGFRTAPGCNIRLAGGLVLMVRRIRSCGFVEERGHPLNLASEPSGHGLGLELQVPPWLGDAYRSPVFKANGDIRWCFDHQTPLDEKELQVQGLCLDTILTTLAYSLARNVNPENDIVWGEMFHHAKNIGVAQRNSTTT